MVVIQQNKTGETREKENQGQLIRVLSRCEFVSAVHQAHGTVKIKPELSYSVVTALELMLKD